jgi:glutamate--cysteine ligase
MHVEMVPPGILDRLAEVPATLTSLQRGIEKESLRVACDGMLSTLPHPRGLGSPLTHPQITTDFSESQLELITGVHATPEACLTELGDVHRFVFAKIGDELLWPASMPCMLPAEEDIPLGRYGTSNVGMSKTVYRRGLANRYGAMMQTISGIHYNFSAPEALFEVLGRNSQQARTDAYFGLIRNFRRHAWLLIYLFGASPSICRSFATEQAANLRAFDEGSLYLPNATSLRMGPLGYQSDAQRGLHMSYNSLDEYAATMRTALTRSYPAYEAIGTRNAGGQYQQLNTSLIQIENEFYGSIRPKNPVQSGERPLTALTNRGVAYVEVRCLDLNPFLRLGIDEVQIRFLDTFLLYCLLSDSPPDSPEESAQMYANQVSVVQEGRDPELALLQGSERRNIREFGHALLDACAPIAERLDQAHGTDEYGNALALQRGKIDDASRTPSARILNTMRQQNMPFFRFAMNQAISHKGFFEEHPLLDEQLAAFEARAEASLHRQRAIEAEDTLAFGDYLEQYLALP